MNLIYSNLSLSDKRCTVICVRKRPDHIDDELAKTLALPLGEVLEDVTVFLVQEFESHSEVVVF